MFAGLEVNIKCSIAIYRIRRTPVEQEEAHTRLAKEVYLSIRPTTVYLHIPRAPLLE